MVGLMSGTSADGIDAALVRVSGYGRQTRARLLRFESYPYPEAVRHHLFRVFRGRGGGVRSVARLHALLGELFAAAAAKVSDGEADLVASHGQTVYHQPESRRFLGRPVRCTYQLGDGCIIAARLGCCVVSDFRSADVAHGGQGAPLVPYADWILLSHPHRHRVALNVGGIANVTWLEAGGTLDDVLAFDTGPGNALIDAAASRLAGRPYDEAGHLASQGTVREDLLAAWLQHPYFQQSPPKSTGRETFGEPLLQRYLEAHPDVPPADLLATLTALTARSIVGALLGLGPVDDLLVGGGGAHNRTLMRMLQEALPAVAVQKMDEAGLPADAREAIAFAILGNETMHAHASNVPSATGATRPAVLGKISLPLFL